MVFYTQAWSWTLILMGHFQLGMFCVSVVFICKQGCGVSWGMLCLGINAHFWLRLFAEGISLGNLPREELWPSRPDWARGSHLILVSGKKELEQAQTLGVTEVTTTPGRCNRGVTQEGRKGLELCLHFAFRGFHLFLSFPNDWRGNMYSNQTLPGISAWGLATAGVHVEHWDGDTK